MAHKVAVAISGSGRTLNNLIACQDGNDYEIAGVIASSATCSGIAFAESNGLPLLVLDFCPLSASAKTQLESWLATHAIEWIALAGFLKPWPTLSRYCSKTINIHPALLPKYGGRGYYGNRVHKAVIEAGEGESGATIHFVTPNYDEGRIIAQAFVPVLPDDDAQRLATRVFAAECLLYPQTIGRLVRGELPLHGNAIWRMTNATEQKDSHARQ